MDKSQGKKKKQFNEDEIFETCKKFNKTVKGLVKIVGKTFPKNAQVWLMQERLSALMSISNEILMEKCFKKIYDIRDKILDEEESFFLDEKVEKKYVDAYIKKDKNEEFLKDMIKLVKQVYARNVATERDFLWGELKKLLEYSVTYMLLTEQHL